MAKLRQLQANRSAYIGSPVQKRRTMVRRALLIIAFFSVLAIVLCACFIFQHKTQKNNDETNKTLVNLPGGQFLPSLKQPINILVMGVDSNGKNTERFIGTRSDSMLLVSLDPQKQKTGIISIPRDSRVQIANGRGIDKINSAHAFGGPELAMATVSQSFNIPIDKYIVVDEQGAKRILEALGPVDVLVEKKMTYTDNTAKLYVKLKPGLQTLNPKQAEQYLRYRHDAKGDIGRIERQQWFARQLLTKLAGPEIVTKLPTLLDIVRECVVTNLSIDEMVRLFGFACHLDSKQIEMATLPGVPGTIEGISYWLLDPVACNAICNKLVSYHPSSDSDSGVAQNTAMPISQDSAIAYTPVSDKSIASLSTVIPTVANKSTHSNRWSAMIRYPKNCDQQVTVEEQVANLEKMLNDAGFVLKGKYKADLADCQHEQIIESSDHALSYDLEGLRNKLPCMSNCPAVINIDSQMGTDFIFVVTPESKFST